ncbi:carboxylesterase/lipase family protein [Catenulispora yoronensis]|uniref:Carboxylesterase/lipase family protein n=1 Tax=Catenulispora yoronensis TaxID=450799 RepID=A0ABP5F136_9ACTN
MESFLRRTAAASAALLGAAVLLVGPGRQIAAAQPAAATTAAAFTKAAAATADPSLVTTDKGVVQGTVAAGNRTFLGIPYAAPPTGALRWKAPAPAAPWTGVRAATAPGNKCAQVEELAGGAVEGSEDCLNLNVYTPDPQPLGKLPVIVFIPGGGYVFGSDNDVDPRALARTENVIVVTVNYRLGALGYLHTPALAAEDSAAAGNFGLLDQQAALKWVRGNIAGFGGDPARTTLSGESAGGAAVWAQVVSPTAAGLFQRAIVESGAGVGFTNQAAADAQGALLATNLGCPADATQLACLRATDVTAILGKELAGAPPILLPSNMAWAPTVGGSALPQTPAAAFANGAYNRVPILQGSNHDEWRLFTTLSGLQLTDASYKGLVGRLFGARAPEVLAQYPDSAYATPTQAYDAIATDEGFVCPARTADRAIAGTVPVYAYEFNDTSAPTPPFLPPGLALGAFHTAELQYVFPRPGFPGMSAAQIALSKEMMAYWADFAAHGTPITAGQPIWTPYVPVVDQFLSLSPTATAPISTFAADHHCSFWATFGS